MATSRMADQVGRVLDGRYRLLAPIGAGGSAAVYSADDVRLRRRVAVKILHADLADDESFLRRFRAEAQAVAALAHPNILSVFDWGEEDGNPYLVMELLGGGSLRNILDRGDRLTPSQALQVGLDAAKALDYAHRRGLVHRDIKPANLLFDEEGRVRIADFGLARALAEASVTEPTGAILGTFRYASPEQARGRSVDGKADVYALALVLVEAVTGQVPFAADTPVATLMARVDNPLHAPPALGPLGPVVEQAGTPDPDDRLDAAGLIAGLDRAARTLPSPRPLPLAGAREIDDTTRIADITVMPAAGPRSSGAASTSSGRAALFDGDTVLMGPADATIVSSGRDGPVGYAPLDQPAATARRRRWPWIILVVALVVALATAAAVALPNATAPSHPVPSLKDQPVAAARAAAARSHFKLKVSREDFTEDKDQGIVLEQSPLAGTKLKEHHTISVVVSKGPAPRGVPDLTGLDEATATQKLQAIGLTVAPDVARPFIEDQPKGAVLDWSPKGVDVAKGTAVHLTVSAGPPQRSISDWKGKSYDDAANAIAKAGLVPKRNDVFDDTIPPNFVVSTTPPANSMVDKGSTVTINVSKGPDLVNVPDVRGQSVDQATATMKAAGLTVANVFGPPDKKVFTTDPATGAQVKRGSAVNLYTK